MVPHKCRLLRQLLDGVLPVALLIASRFFFVVLVSACMMCSSNPWLGRLAVQTATASATFHTAFGAFVRGWRSHLVCGMHHALLRVCIVLNESQLVSFIYWYI